MAQPEAAKGAAKGLSNVERTEALARAEGHPQWLRELREEAFDAFGRLEYPTKKLEEWRYTDVSQLKLEEVAPAAPHEGVAPAEAEALLEGKDAAAKILVVGASIVSIEVDPALAERGLVVQELATAATEHPELVRQHLGSAVPMGQDRLAALNGALWTAGIFVHVPKDLKVEQPIRVARWLPEGGVAVFPRTLIVAEAYSHLAYIDDLASPDFDEPTVSLGAVEVIAREGADVQYVAVQQWGEGVHHLSMQRTIAGKDANLDTLVVNLGATVARVDLNARLEGPGSRSDMLGLYFGRDRQHFDHNTRQDHVSDNANSDLLYKGALYDRSKAVFRGIIRVHPGAQRTDAYQTNRNLLLSSDAEAVSLPNLEIEADDVKCSHGATVGQLDEEEMFYLMSRGLDKRQAERLVIFGFFGEVLDRLPLPDVVEELKTAIEARIR